MSFDKILKAGRVYFNSGYITQAIFTFIMNLKYVTDRRRKLLYLGFGIDCRHEMEKFRRIPLVLLSQVGITI